MLDETICTSASREMDSMLGQMRGIFFVLQDENVEVVYTPYTGDQQHGFIGRPGGAPMRVTVRYSCQTFNWFFVAARFQWPMLALPQGCGNGTGILIPASYTLSSEVFGRPT